MNLDDARENRGTRGPTVDLSHVVADQSFGRRQLLDEMQQVSTFPLDEHNVVDLDFGRINRRESDALTAFDPPSHGASLRSDIDASSLSQFCKGVIDPTHVTTP